MISSNIVNFKLENTEYCYNLETTPCGAGGTMKMYVPKLMPKIGFGEPKSVPETYAGDVVFINDKECKPDCDNSFQCQNYIDMSLMYNNDWKHKVDLKGKVNKKSKFLCTFMNGNITKGTFSTNI